MDFTISNEIKRQLGSKALFMMGAKKLVADDNSLSFKFSSKRYNYLRIELTANDDYELTFIKYNKNGVVRETIIKGIYVDKLHETIREETGLDLTL